MAAEASAVPVPSSAGHSLASLWRKSKSRQPILGSRSLACSSTSHTSCNSKPLKPLESLRARQVDQPRDCCRPKVLGPVARGPRAEKRVKEVKETPSRGGVGPTYATAGSSTSADFSFALSMSHRLFEASCQNIQVTSIGVVPLTQTVSIVFNQSLMFEINHFPPATTSGSNSCTLVRKEVRR